MRTELSNVLDDLNRSAEDWLKKGFGTFGSFKDGCGYHNHSHGEHVATAAEWIATKLYEARRVPQETIVLARYAGWRHDAVQGPGHEQKGAQLAAYAMRARGLSEQHIASVVKMIEATRVTGIEGCRILQATDPGDLEQALLADADLSALGRRGIFPALMMGLEQQHLSRLITLPSPTDGMLAEPDYDAMVKYLTFQFGLYDQHRYLLDVSRKLFPHQEANRDEVGRVLELYRSGSISFSQMLIEAKRNSMS